MLTVGFVFNFPQFFCLGLDHPLCAGKIVETIHPTNQPLYNDSPKKLVSYNPQVLFSTEGDRMLSCGEDGYIKVVDVNTEVSCIG